MKLGWIDKAMGAAIAGSVFTMMESTSHAVSSVISAAFNASASPEGRILAAGIALSGVAIEGYAAFLAANWAAIGHSVSSRPDTNDSNKTTAITAAALKPSDRMPDGTGYAGISPESGKPIDTP